MVITCAAPPRRFPTPVGWLRIPNYSCDAIPSDPIRAYKYIGRYNSAGPGNVQPRQLFCGSYVAATHILSASTGDIFFSLTRNASINGTG
jgi:hypothetical protein